MSADGLQGDSSCGCADESTGVGGESCGSGNSESCQTSRNGAGSARTDRYDLVIVGGGSAAFSAAIKTSELGGRAVIINDGLPIGGTCVNVGCIPSKAMIRAAEAHHRSNNHEFSGIESNSQVTNFGAITRQTQALVEDLRQGKYVDVTADDPNISLVAARARISDPHTVIAGGITYRADSILIATGARTFIPPIPGLAQVPFLTNETLYTLAELPSHMIVLGGGYIAIENAQMLARLGSKVTLLQRSARILKNEHQELTDALVGFLAADGVDVRTGITIEKIRAVRRGVQVDVKTDGGQLTVDGDEQPERSTIEGSHVFVATGRIGNTENLGLTELGLETTEDSFIQVDETLRTNVDNIFAAGDVLGEHQFVYAAAYEGGLAAENAPHSMRKERNYTVLPWVIFTDPQLAGVGMDERQAEESGINFEVARLDLTYVPRSLVARDTRGFIKLIRDVDTDLFVGARILAPEGSELLMEVVLAIRHGITVEELKSTFHPYLTLSEGIKLAAISFGKDVAKLSCCAS